MPIFYFFYNFCRPVSTGREDFPNRACNLRFGGLFCVNTPFQRENEKKEGDGLVKGAQKQMIVVKTADSRYFDEAYFVLRREVKGARCVGRDMLAEANKILEECGADSHGRRRRMPRALP